MQQLKGLTIFLSPFILPATPPLPTSGCPCRLPWQILGERIKNTLFPFLIGDQKWEGELVPQGGEGRGEALGGGEGTGAGAGRALTPDPARRSLAHGISCSPHVNPAKRRGISGISGLCRRPGSQGSRRSCVDGAPAAGGPAVPPGASAGRGQHVSGCQAGARPPPSPFPPAPGRGPASCGEPSPAVKGSADPAAGRSGRRPAPAQPNARRGDPAAREMRKNSRCAPRGTE